MASIHVSLFPPFSPLLSVGAMTPFATVKGRGRFSLRWRRDFVRASALDKALEPLYEDGHGSVGLKDYVDAAIDLVKESDGGPPRWFCPTGCGPLVDNAPVLLFLPDLDGIGLGLFLHHKSLGRVFEIRCLHIPAHDRTPFEELVKIVENIVRAEHSIGGGKPIYLMGHSFGGCLAFSVAAKNPNVDLVLILSNPATSFGLSKFLPSFPIMRNISHQLNMILPYLLSTGIGNQLKMSLNAVEKNHNLLDILEQYSERFSENLFVSSLLNTMSEGTFQWKLMLLKEAADCANSSLHSIKAEVLLLNSSQIFISPNGNEAERLSMLLSNCRIHRFWNHGYNILLDGGVNLLTIIKGTNMYRRSKDHDHFSDYIPPTAEELRTACANRWAYLLASPVFFSTSETGKIVKGLSGIPTEGPVLLVGNHMLLGAEAMMLVIEFLKEKRVVLHGVSHPVLFPMKTQTLLQWTDFYLLANVFGALPVSHRNLYRLFSEKCFVLLYPGGAREALHRKGEEYKLIWPDQAEFVRMATRFGATIVPFGAVGEDDMVEQLLDYDDIIRVPIISDLLHSFNKGLSFDSMNGERKQELIIPVVRPKIPGRFYFLFGKPISTRGRHDLVKDREAAKGLYNHVRTQVELCISYLKTKREDDGYRNIFQRILFKALWGSSIQIPSFEP